MTKVSDFRKADYPVDPVFIERWSPRAFIEGREIPDEVLFSCFEAARWAPSSGNAQPWRFIYAKRGEAQFGAFVETCAERTQGWIRNASAVVFFVSRTTIVLGGTERVSQTHSFDCGAAWENFGLQALKLGWATHAAGSFDRAAAAAAAGLPQDWSFNCIVGIGQQADKSVLAAELAEREFPSARLPVSRLAMQGGFRPDQA
jgi:nitroreductase